jgi:hypothetical protein
VMDRSSTVRSHPTNVNVGFQIFRHSCINNVVVVAVLFTHNLRVVTLNNTNAVDFTCKKNMIFSIGRICHPVPVKETKASKVIVWYGPSCSQSN